MDWARRSGGGRWRGGSARRAQVVGRVEAAAQGGLSAPAAAVRGRAASPEDAAQHILHMSSEEEEV